jgi:hypothetical protein
MKYQLLYEAIKQAAVAKRRRPGWREACTQSRATQ